MTTDTSIASSAPASAVGDRKFTAGPYRPGRQSPPGRSTVVTIREPDADEVTTLRGFLEKQKQRFTADGVNPWALVVDDDKAKEKVKAELPAASSPADLAAWTALARVVLNLDETITKE